MGINRQDVQLVNSSLKDLGDSLLHERMMQQQQAERESQDALKQQQIGVDQERWNATQQHQKRLEDIDAKRYDAEQAHQKTMESKQTDILQHQQSQAALANLQNAYNGLSQAVYRGSMTADQANAAAKRIVDGVRTGTDTILQNSPFSSMLDDPEKPIFTAPAPRQVRGPAGVETDQAASALEQQADMADDLGDSETADELRTRARSLRQTMRQGPVGYTETIESVDPITGQPSRKVVTRQPAGPGIPLSAPSAVPPVVKMVRDPKTGRLVPGQ